MSKKILIADDTAYMRTVIREALSAIDVDIVGEAENGEQALALFKEHNPDLLILNIVMPPPDGLAVLQQIKSEKPTAQVLMCSAMGQASTVFAAIRAGADDFLVKPFDPQRLVQTVNRLLHPELAPINKS